VLQAADPRRVAGSDGFRGLPRLRASRWLMNTDELRAPHRAVLFRALYPNRFRPQGISCRTKLRHLERLGIGKFPLRPSRVPRDIPERSSIHDPRRKNNFEAITTLRKWAQAIELPLVASNCHRARNGHCALVATRGSSAHWAERSENARVGNVPSEPARCCAVLRDGGKPSYRVFNDFKYLMADPARFELATSAFGGQRLLRPVAIRLHEASTLLREMRK
jgi:hypothetical protein